MKTSTEAGIVQINPAGIFRPHHSSARTIRTKMYSM
jgi:hypothetical protein